MERRTYQIEPWQKSCVKMSSSLAAQIFGGKWNPSSVGGHTEHETLLYRGPNDPDTGKQELKVAGVR